MLERIVERGNLNRAYKRVKKNNGAGGIDGMTADELLQYFKENGEELRQAVLGREIPTSAGKKGINNQRTRKETETGNTNIS